jgi:hypothetical protein
MSERPDRNAELLDELRAVLARVDPAPPEVAEFAKAAIGWRRLDADLAELLADSALETESAALTRSGASLARSLTFRAADLAIDVEIRADGESRILLGQLAPPPAAATVEVQGDDGSVVASVEADALGRFRVTLEAGGRLRLRVLRRDPPGTPVETSWLSL